MSNTKPIPDVIETIINSLSFSVAITSVTNTASETVIGVCNTGHISPFSSVVINGVTYEVRTVAYNENITLSMVVTPAVGDLITIAAPFYFHGTTRTTGADVIRIKNGDLKYPMVYLFEPLEERFNEDDNNPVNRTAVIRLFLLDISNFSDWSTDEHYLYAINPMRNLAERFIEALKASPLFSKLGNYKIISHAKIGQLLNRSTHLKSLFADKASGVELKINIGLYDDCVCTALCDC